MNEEILYENETYRTADLALASAIYLFHPLQAIDRQSSTKAVFLFSRTTDLDELIETYWRGDLKVEPQAYFNAIRTVKARLYGDK